MRKHLFYYITLVALIATAVLLMKQFASQKQLQMTLVVVLAVCYVFWGVLHHYLHHNLRARIVLEYVAVGALGVTAILLIFKGVF